jgi:hypothetical protein
LRETKVLSLMEACPDEIANAFRRHARSASASAMPQRLSR